jgi:hypothetical protein
MWKAEAKVELNLNLNLNLFSCEEEEIVPCP